MDMETDRDSRISHAETIKRATAMNADPTTKSTMAHDMHSEGERDMQKVSDR